MLLKRFLLVFLLSLVLMGFGGLVLFIPAKAEVDIEYMGTAAFTVEAGEEYMEHPDFIPIPGPTTVPAGGKDKFLCHGQCGYFEFHFKDSVALGNLKPGSVITITGPILHDNPGDGRRTQIILNSGSTQTVLHECPEDDWVQGDCVYTLPPCTQGEIEVYFEDSVGIRGLEFYAAPDTPPFSEDEVATASLPGIVQCEVAWGDYDNDGTLDILLAGYNGSNRLTKVYKNMGDGTFTENQAASAILIGVKGNAAWGDYDNDGDLDILLTGNTGPGNRNTKVYKNMGDGTFTENQAASAILIGVKGDVAWGDYDNDGDLDILLTGHAGSGNRNTKVYDNTGDGTFVENEVASSVLVDIMFSSVAWGDYDNDGDLDILLAGCNNYTSLCVSRIAKVYENTGDGTFSENVAASAVLADVSGGEVAWGDYDNDGDLDILLTGYDGSNRITKIYENTGDGMFSENQAASSVLTDVRHGDIAWGDYDNDGDLDVVLTGGDASQHIASVYKNLGDGTFTEDQAASTVLTGVKGDVAWGDYDNDGNLDILLTGNDGQGNRIAKVYRNNSCTANIPPSAPTDLSAAVSEQTVTLSWSAPTPLNYTTPHPGLTYNLRVGSNPGQSDVLAPMSCVGNCGSSSDGYRQVPQLGQANHGLTATLILPAGTYYWSVQAIDHAFTGSAFAPESNFTISP